VCLQSSSYQWQNLSPLHPVTPSLLKTITDLFLLATPSPPSSPGIQPTTSVTLLAVSNRRIGNDLPSSVVASRAALTSYHRSPSVESTNLDGNLRLGINPALQQLPQGLLQSVVPFSAFHLPRPGTSRRRLMSGWMATRWPIVMTTFFKFLTYHHSCT
jgi:hypothetical protein